jgi:hypothetical protein
MKNKEIQKDILISAFEFENKFPSAARANLTNPYTYIVKSWFVICGYEVELYNTYLNYSIAEWINQYGFELFFDIMEKEYRNGAIVKYDLDMQRFLEERKKGLKRMKSLEKLFHGFESSQTLQKNNNKDADPKKSIK